MTGFSNGFLILDKPEGISSAQAVGAVKRTLGCSKIGHGGTLDPLASGILPLAIGEATKAISYVVQSEKGYRFTVTFGESRETDDAEGTVVETTGALPTREQLEAALPEFMGRILQVPPIYSALKINGQRAYKMARAGEQVEMTARPIDVYGLELLASEPQNGPVQSATFAVRCGKGTYVRSLARDIAIKCNSLGYVSMLRRTSVGKFAENRAISLDKLQESVHNAALLEAWYGIELALDDIPAIDIAPEQEAKLRYGQSFAMNTADGKYMALHQGRIVALVENLGGMLKPLRVFNI